MNALRIAGMVLMACTTAAAVAADPTSALTFEEVAQRTLASRPEFRRFAIERRAMDARRELAALRPAIELGIEAEGLAGTGDYRGVDSAELGLSLGTVFERGGKRTGRIEVADRAADLMRVEQRVEALDLLAETGRRFIDVAVAAERITLAEQAFEQATRTVDLVRPRVNAARAPRTELLNAEIALTAARLARAAAGRELESAQMRLASQWGASLERPTVTASLRETAAPKSYSELESELAKLPDLARFASERALRDAEARLVRAQRSADWRTSIGVRRYEASGDQALMFSWSMPLGSAARNAPAEREAAAVAEGSDLRLEATASSLRSTLFRQLQLLEVAREQLIAIGEEDLPRAREALVLTERGYRIGRFPYRELSLVQAQVIDLQLAQLDAAAAYHTTYIEIERLTGARLALIPE